MISKWSTLYISSQHAKIGSGIRVVTILQNINYSEVQWIMTSSHWREVDGQAWVEMDKTECWKLRAQRFLFFESWFERNIRGKRYGQWSGEHNLSNDENNYLREISVRGILRAGGELEGSFVGLHFKWICTRANDWAKDCSYLGPNIAHIASFYSDK